MTISPFRAIAALLGLYLALGTAANAHQLVARSGSGTIRLVELYSSESCSSCPPADRWMSTLKGHPGLWKSFVPVVFHVDYWNDLGWKDGLSASSMTKRQRDVAATWAYDAAALANRQSEAGG